MVPRCGETAIIARAAYQWCQVMHLSQATFLKDSRVGCLSVMFGMTIEEYLSIAQKAYEDKGGLTGQRAPLKTTTGKRIRARLVEDIKRGAVIPPVVIGVVISEELEEVSEFSLAVVSRHLTTEWSNKISIIDGMQRTTALLEAFNENPSSIGVKEVRVECWISKNTEALIYRMLVLNTGQVPWDIKRQLMVVYRPLIDEMKEKIQFDRLLDSEKSERRTRGGQFNAVSLVELYIAFGIRKTEIDPQESLADEFSRLDIAESIASEKYDDFFYPIIDTMVKLDKSFSRLDLIDPEALDEELEAAGKFSNGRHIFDKQPARIGYVVACTVYVLGRLGMNKEAAESAAAAHALTDQCSALSAKLNEMSENELASFLALDVLRDRLSGQKRSAVGRYERTFFESAFKILIEQKFFVPSMEACWRNA